MTIETKYNIGDEVWYSLKGNIYHETIDHIEIDVGKDRELHIYYNAENKFPHRESKLFPTKEELLRVCSVWRSYV